MSWSRNVLVQVSSLEDEGGDMEMNSTLTFDLLDQISDSGPSAARSGGPEEPEHRPDYLSGPDPDQPAGQMETRPPTGGRGHAGELGKGAGPRW